MGYFCAILGGLTWAVFEGIRAYMDLTKGRFIYMLGTCEWHSPLMVLGTQWNKILEGWV